MGLVIYEIIVAVWNRINKFKKAKEIKKNIYDSEIIPLSQSNITEIEINQDSEDKIFQISDYIENDVAIIDYDDFSTDSYIFSSPNHYLYHPTLPYCNSLPNSPKSCSLLNRGLSSPYLYGADHSQSHIFDKIYNEVAQLKRELKEIKSKIKRFSRQYYVISTSIDNCNNAVEELNANDYLCQLREFNEEESRSLDLEEKIMQLCRQLDLREDVRMSSLTDAFPSFFLPDSSITDQEQMSPSYLYDEDWSTKESSLKRSRWNLDF